ncbi:hypothetical protein IIY67_02600, partial [Candidatus Saccharibacteria bacterium]|nr:hypothetical protein [Candidatus Saccharibacteria bacterium]
MVDMKYGGSVLGFLVSAVLLSFFISVAPGLNVFAAQGQGEQVTHRCKLHNDKEHGGGPYTRGGRPNDLLTCMKVGAAFAYFEYTADATESLSIGSNMGPVTEHTDKYIEPIKGCTKYGGFMHLGLIDEKNSDTWSRGNVWVSYAGNISLGNFNLDSVEVWASDANSVDVGKQDIYVGNTHVASLKGFVSEDEAYNRYGEWREASGAADLWSSGTLGWFCWSKDMGEATYDAKTDVSGSNGNMTSNGGKYSITFKHSMRRTDDTSFKPQNGSSWQTNVSGGGNKKYGNFTSTSKSFSTVSSETISGTLLPGEQKTFCQSLTYDSRVTSSGERDSATTERKCRTVKRDEATCFGRNYGVDNGKNYGKISLNKNNRSWIDAQPNNPEGFSESMREASVEAWTRPNDGVKFKTEMCEGAELANQYHNINKNILYSLTATDVQYLGGLSPHEWSNSGLKSRSNAGTGIFGGSYTNQTQTPHNGQFSITESHVGKSFNQTLAWTDLWMSGGAIVDSHNPGGKTWQNVAIATVHTPYNYTTGITLKSNNLKYGLAGTNISGFELSLRRNARKNPKVTEDGSSYVTKTKPTKFQVFSFKVASGVPEASVKLNDEYVRGDGSGIACGNYLSSAGGCEIINRASGDKVLSGDSTILNNSTDKQISVSI